MSTISRPPKSSPDKTRKYPDRYKVPSFEYGYRNARRKGPNGRLEWTRVPLTLLDVLHPQEGDVHVLSDPHTEDYTYLRTILKERNANDPSVAILSDCGIFWDQPGLEHHSPDLAVIFGVKRRKGWKTFRVKTEKVRPSLIIEVTSPKTRVLDINDKVAEYAMAKVACYVIADAQETEEDENGGRRRLKLIAYQLKGKTYKPLPVDQDRGVWLEPVKLWLAVRVNAETGEDRLALIEPASGSEIGDYTAVCRALREALALAETEKRTRVEAQARADAEAQTRIEAQARADADAARADTAEARAIAAVARAIAAEELIRRQEAELRRLRKRKGSQ
jgi:colicin import membrane protein